MADIKIDERTKLGVLLPMRVWVGGVCGLVVIVGSLCAGWYDLNQRNDERFAAVMKEVSVIHVQVGNLDDKWQLRLVQFGEKFAQELGGRQEIVTLRERQNSMMQTLDEIKRRLDKVEAREP